MARRPDYLKSFAKSPAATFSRYGANIAGFFWSFGTAALFIFGLIASSPREIIAALFNTVSPCSFMFFGHRVWGVIAGNILGIIGTFLAVWPEIRAGELGSVLGFIAFCGFVSISIFAVPIMRRYMHAKNPVILATLGHPRRLSGWGPFFFTRIPIIWESIAHGRWKLALVFALWGLGDIAFGFSKPRLTTSNK